MGPTAISLSSLRAPAALQAYHRICAVISVLLIAGCSGTSPGWDGGISDRVPPTAAPALTPTERSSQTPTPTTSPTLTPTPVCRYPEGWREQVDYLGAVRGEAIPMQVFLPPCYDPDVERYPTLYLLHGYPFDETQWDELGIDELVLDGVLHGDWPPFVMVMPFAPEPLFISSDGGPGSYEQELLEGVLPFIEARYATESEAWARAIAGISRGGVWALEIGFRNPAVFNTVAALSPALHVNYARPPYDPYNLASEADRLPEHIFLSAGDAEWSFRAGTERLAEALIAVGIDPIFVNGVGGHEAGNWQGVLNDLLMFIMSSWQR